MGKSRCQRYDSLDLQNNDLIAFKDSVDVSALGKFYEIDKSLADTSGANKDSLQNVNNNIITGNAIEDLIKVLNAIKMDFEKYNVLTDPQVNVIKEIAPLCPYTSGPAVYTARALLRGVNGVRGEYMNECEKIYPLSYSSRQSQIDSNFIIDEKQLDLSVLPNPASNSIIINHFGNYNTMIIEEISGKVLFMTSLNGSVNSELFDVSNLNSGIYILKLNGKTEMRYIKLVINK